MKRLKIDESILKKTTKCEGDFSCLSGDDKCLFNVEDTIRDSACYVTCEEDECAYWLSHGFMGAVCSCPTRVEIYKRHKKCPTAVP